ncbi:hypothetical protein KCP69_15805 [Salmonella enterica subsp. enterica]|nr:hypothetical protein KCP69_15805 [Salmonella enterica subsp. enterica]
MTGSSRRFWLSGFALSAAFLTGCSGSSDNGDKRLIPDPSGDNMRIVDLAFCRTRQKSQDNRT